MILYAMTIYSWWYNTIQYSTIFYLLKTYNATYYYMVVKSKGIVMWMILIVSVVMVTDIVGGEGQDKRSS